VELLRFVGLAAAYRGIVAEEPRAQPPDRDRNSTPAVTDDHWRIPSI
jgi:hypothetical protein